MIDLHAINLRQALRKHAIHRKLIGHTERWACAECDGFWRVGDAECHKAGCLAAPARHIPTSAEWAHGHTESVADAVEREQHRGGLVTRVFLGTMRLLAALGLRKEHRS